MPCVVCKGDTKRGFTYCDPCMKKDLDNKQLEQDLEKNLFNEDIPIHKWIDSKFITVKQKKHSKLEEIKLQFGMRHSDSNGWLKVTHVLDGGAAQLAGLATGDLLASINGERITAARWDKVLSSLITGQIIQICFYRDDLEHECMTVLEDDQIPSQYTLMPTE